MPTALALALAFLAGVALAVQIPVNVQLRVGVGHPTISAFISFALGAAVLAAYILVARLPLPGPAALAGVPWWGWLGGALGAYYVTSTILLGPKIGAALFVTLMIAGQLAMALVIDHWGWLGAAAQPVTTSRLLGVGLAAAGVYLIQRP